MKIIKIFIGSALVLIIGITVYSCSTSQMVSEKSGAQLWGENCNRCHNIPPTITFSDAQWETVGMHMRVRGNLTEEETSKIVEFLQSAN